MKNKKIIILTCLILALSLCISTISAAELDNGTSDINLQKDNTNENDSNSQSNIENNENVNLENQETNHDYYVSNEGSDENNGTLESPYKTIENAINQTDTGRTINIHLSEGTFKDKGNSNLTINSNINLMGISTEKTIIDGSNINWLANINNGILNIENLTIKNFYLKLNESGTRRGIITSNSNINFKNVNIENNTIETLLGNGENKSTIYTGVILSTGEINLNNVTGAFNKINNTKGSDLTSLRTLADWGCIISSFNKTVINNSNFYNNTGSRSSVVYAHTLTSLDINNSKFENNTATYCGGVFLTYLNTTTHIKNSFFKKNNGTNAGGIIYQQRYSNMYVENSTFEGNYANTGGSLYAHHYSNLTANDSSFSKGRARTGAAIIGADFVKLNINNCNFENNTASEGAVMGDEGCEINVDNSKFSNNKADFGAAVFGDMINNITVKNSILNNNTATYGGAIFGTFESNIKIINNTFTNNNAENGSVVFVDNTGKLDEEEETPEYNGITSSIYSKNNTFTNNTSKDNLIIVNYELENKENEKVKKATNIIFQNMTITAVNYKNGERGKYLIITLKNENGNVLANKSIEIGINGAIYKRITNENGTAKLQINLASKGVYTFSIAFLGDNDYKGSFNVGKIKVIPKTSTIKISNTHPIKVKTFRTLTFYLKGVSTLDNKKYINGANKKLIVTVNGKKYNLKTDKNGKTTLKIRFPKTGIYTITTSFKGDSTFASKTIKSKIRVRK